MITHSKLGTLLILAIIMATAQLATAAYPPSAGTVFQIAADPGTDENCSDVSGDLAVWYDTTSDYGVKGIDLATGQSFQIVPSPDQSAGQWMPRISGSMVMWSVHRPLPGQQGGIIARDLQTQQEWVLAPPAFFRLIRDCDIEGDLAMWIEATDSGDDLYGKRLNGGDAFLIGHSDGEISSPRASGDVVVWSDNVTLSGASTHGKNIVTGEDYTFGGDTSHVGISGDLVIWAASGSPEHLYSDLFGKNLATGQEFVVSAHDANQYDPEVDGDWVIWRENDAGMQILFAQELSSGKEIEIFRTDGSIWDHAISGNTIVWSESGDDVYGYIIPGPATMSMLALGGLAMLRRRSP